MLKHFSSCLLIYAYVYQYKINIGLLLCLIPRVLLKLCVLVELNFGQRNGQKGVY